MGAPAYFDEGQQYNFNPDTDAFLAGIAQMESGGSDDPYNVTNQIGARGKYQFMPETYAGLAQQYGVSGDDWSPENQEYIAHAWASDLLNKYGPRGAAQAWLGGEGSVGNEDAADANGTTTGSYADNVLNTMNQYLNGGGTNVASVAGTPYQTNLIEAYRRAGGRLNNPNEPFPSDFVQRMMSQPTVNASQRVLNDFLVNQSPEITARAMGAYDRNKDFFNMVNKMSAAAAKEGADIENKNRQKTMAAQFADQIAQSNNTANIALLARLGAALTGVQFDPNNKQLADAGQLAIKQIELNNQAIKAREAQRNADRQYALDKMKTDAYLANLANRGSYSRGGSTAGGAKGTAGGIGNGGQFSYVVQDQDSINNAADKLFNDPTMRKYLDVLQSGGSTPDARNMATQSAVKMATDYAMAAAQRGERGTFMEIVNNRIPSLLSQNEEMSHPAGTNPADQEHSQQTVMDEMDAYMNQPIGTSASGQPYTLRDVYNTLENTTNQVAPGTQVNHF